MLQKQASTVRENFQNLDCTTVAIHSWTESLTSFDMYNPAYLTFDDSRFSRFDNKPTATYKLFVL